MDRSLISNYEAAAQITIRRLLKFDATAPFAKVQLAAAATDKVVGVCVESGDNGAATIAAGNRCDVVLSGLTPAEAGAAFAAGDMLMSDASGRVIAATAAAGSNIRVVGIAMQPASAAGDIVDIFVNAMSFQG